jgi:(1->4)-alpha-D-glucan 1-alpha-D-glucosylmutase
MHESRAPVLRATYRVQLHAGFTLRDATAVVPYLHELGISHLYASPILAARVGSRHGYDAIDPRRINPELGTEEDLKALAAALHERGMGLLVDIVPNHMAASAENPYWEDVLAHGDRSRYATWFDIDWRMHPDHRVVLPILRDELDAVVERGELRVEVSASGARLIHFEASVPISADTEPESLQLAQWDPAAASEAERLFAGRDGEGRLRALLDAQHYRLVAWRHAAREINYRRFFDVNDLVALRAEDPRVFAETHELILRLIGNGMIDALRVDHVDGLRDPADYLARLRAETDRRSAGGIPIVVEKILMYGEQLRESWPVDGTTGYERLNDIEDLFVHPEGFASIERKYLALRRSPGLTFDGTVRADKRAVLDRAFAADVKRLARLLDELFSAQGRTSTREQIYHGLEEFVAAFPVYRSYVDGSGSLHPDDEHILKALAAHAPGTDATVANTIATFALRPPTHQPTIPPSHHPTEFIARMQQLTGPAMAKGMEDTAHYAYVPLVSRNEVGGAPNRSLANAIEHFHDANARYAAHRPRSLVATATHDTKRSGDTRARITALSELPDEWQRSVARWRRLNRRHRRIVHSRIVPDPNAELFLYQTLVGIWPAPRPGRRADDVPDKPWRSAALDRLKQYMLKAVREAKLRTTWTEPDQAYESALMDFVTALFESPEDDPFLSDVGRLVSRVAPIAQWNSLARVLIHLTMPGTPDIYQGDELWNFAFVDPDNRRPVDYAARASSLGSVLEVPASADAEDIFSHGSPKMLVTRRALAARRLHERLFTAGDYQPLQVTGTRSTNVIAFARSSGGEHAIVVAPRLVGELLGQPAADRWHDTVVELPTNIAQVPLRCAITGRIAVIRENKLVLAKTVPEMAFGLFLGAHARS